MGDVPGAAAVVDESEHLWSGFVESVRDALVSPDGSYREGPELGCHRAAAVGGGGGNDE
ncbi:MAG: hypothetical protein OYK82_04795 [Gammaproteobacteria bacterium]|nr:hypothetical protein [Gammaproteobacteria bacterium]